MVTTRSQTTSPSSSSSSSLTKATSDQRPTTVIIGTGWAGWTLAQELSTKDTNVIVISPHRTMTLTPLLASAACSIFDFRIAEEPVRRRNKPFKKYQASCSSIDFNAKTVLCRSAIGSQRSGEGEKGGMFGESGEFHVGYDTLILAPGCETNTFDTPGVKENSLFMKSVKDAATFRERILDCFEEASLPTLSAKQRADVLHFVIIGGGPTGIELAAEVDELVHQHLLFIYPHLKGQIKISVYDVADRVLGQFGEKLSEYATSQFRARDSVSIRTGRNIEAVEPNCLRVKEDGRVSFGVCVWAVGNKVSPLVDSLNIRKVEGLPRMATDNYLRVLVPTKEKDDASREFRSNIYALGDAADILDCTLPTTAEVAVQKAQWLAKYLNSDPSPERNPKAAPFEYKQKALVAYIGRGDGVIGGKQDWTGVSAWLAWRSGSLTWARSWRRRAMVGIYWVMNFLDGREVARK